MAGTPVQLAQASTAQTAPLFVTAAFPSANTIHNFLFYAVSWDGGGGVAPTTTMSDTLGNTFIKIASLFDATNNLYTEIGYVKDCLGGANTVKCDFGSLGLNNFKAVACWEWSGLDTTAPFTSGEFNGQTQTGTASLTSGNTPTLATQPAIVIGFSTVKHALDGTTNLTAGSGYTPITGGNFWDFGFAGNEFAMMEYKRVLATTAVAATFTAGSTGDKYDTYVAVFKEAGGGGGTTFTKTLSVSSANTLALVRGVRKPFGISSANTLTLTRGIAKTFPITTSTSTALSQGLLKKLTLAITTAAAATLSARRVFLTTSSVSSAVTVGLVKKIGKSLAATSANAVALVRKIANTFAVSSAVGVTLSEKLSAKRSASVSTSASVSLIVNTVRHMVLTFSSAVSVAFSFVKHLATVVTLSHGRKVLRQLYHFLTRR